MDIAKFVLAAIGTFLSVSGLSFTVFTYWKKKQEEKDATFRQSISELILVEKEARIEDHRKLEKRVDYLENTLLSEMQRRMGEFGGELKGIKPILQSIQNWFISNTPGK
ncbi:hypothetical protein [Sediminispirochaeta bajacaliforniensis]|uniref:hypothetical protein n=1 Tax=Sediminispirochaeta bajacaliforniensis TaxID=148 RepID=UPI0003761110|nr:hypothetical protein [Sediminispirochaeta bajacaliforniensis]